MAIFGAKNIMMTKKEAAKMLGANPEALEAFEKEYAIASMNEQDDNFFGINSRMASKIAKETAPDDAESSREAEILTRRIVEELIAITPVWRYDGESARAKAASGLFPIEKPVTKEDVNRLPKEMRPQLTGQLAVMDIGESSSRVLLWHLDHYLKEKDPAKKQMYYHQFRSGLDILDVDAITSEIIGMNPNSMGRWLPEIVKALDGEFLIPKTTIVKLPLTVLQMAHLDYFSLTQTTKDIVNRWAEEVFELDPKGDYFIKTGTYSSKFDFRNCRVKDPDEIKEIGEYLLFIHSQALQMAGPLAQPRIYGVSTTNEWVVREYIKDDEGNPTIYHGLPLHTEYRVFVDFDTDEIIGYVPYWEPQTMYKRFNKEADKDSADMVHDSVIFLSHENTLMKRYEDHLDDVLRRVGKLIPKVGLTGQWSVDIMLNGDDLWLIDMAIAENSAFYDCVPEEKRRPAKENWIPKLPAVK